jgi:hypothetical protein
LFPKVQPMQIAHVRDASYVFGWETVVRFQLGFPFLLLPLRDRCSFDHVEKVIIHGFTSTIYLVILALLICPNKLAFLIYFL